MEPALWKSLPESSNTEESLHWQFYAAQGKDHGVVEGFGALYAIAQAFERRHQGFLSTYFLAIS